MNRPPAKAWEQSFDAYFHTGHEEPYYVDELDNDAIANVDNGYYGDPGSANLKVHCFWDLDNKQLSGREEVERVVPHLRRALATLGRVHAIKAFGNMHSFDYLPAAEKVAREERESFSKGEGMVFPCTICGAKLPSKVKLAKHFQDLHQRERTKKLSGRTPKQRERFLADTRRNGRFLEMKDCLIPPKRGFGLQHKLQVADIQVKKVSNEPQAADWALKQEVAELLEGLSNRAAAQEHLICIISDDRGFRETFRKCKDKGCHTLSISHATANFTSCADFSLEWEMLKEGLYEELLGLRGRLS